MYQILVKNKKEDRLSTHLNSSHTDIARIPPSARNTESAADFVHKLAISLKEANDTEY